MGVRVLRKGVDKGHDAQLQARGVGLGTRGAE